MGPALNSALTRVRFSPRSRVDGSGDNAARRFFQFVTEILPPETAMAYTIKVNGTDHTVDVDGDMPLLWVLRDVLGMTGTKFGCGMALCGACTVHMDGTPIRSCITTIDSVGTSAITTIEAIGETPAGAENSESLDRSRSAAMRLLPVRPDHVRVRPAGRQCRIRAMPISTMPCPAISAAAAPMCASAKRSSRRRSRPRRRTERLTMRLDRSTSDAADRADRASARGFSRRAFSRPAPPPAAACC